MKKHYLILALCVLPLILLSQSATLTEVKTVSGIGKTHRINIYPDGNEGIVLQDIQQGLLSNNVFYEGNLNNNNLSLTHLDNSNKIISQESYKLKNTDFSLRKTFMFGNQIIAIYDWYEGKADTYHLAYVKIDGSRIESANPIPMCSFPLEKRKHKDIMILVSENKKYFALANQIEERKDDAIVNCAVFDEDFNIVWKKENIVLASKYETNSIDNMMLGNDKNLYIIHESYNKEKNVIVQFESAIVILNDEGTQREIIDFNEFVPALSKLHQKDNKIIMIGYYLLPKKTGLSGIYNTIFDPKTMAFTDFERLDFTNNLINDFNFNEASKQIKRQNITNLKIRHIVDLKDGSTMVFAEESYIRIVTTSSSKGGSSTTYYYYDNSIIYSRINKDGSIAWSKILPKFQVTKNSRGSVNSFGLHVSDNSIFLIYNDNIKNLNNTIAKGTKAYSGKGTIVCARIDTEDGSLKKELLLLKGNPKMRFYREFLSVSKEEGVFIGKQAYKTYICRVNFN